MEDIFTGNKRILILQNIDKNITLSNEMIQRALKTYGHTTGIEEVNRHLIWLESRALIKLEKLSIDIWAAKLSRHGKDVARGNIRENGVDDPVED